MAQMTLRSFGWKPDFPDHRDLLFSAPLEVLQNLPSAFSLRDQCTFPIYDQGQLGSCTANAIGAAIQFDQVKQKIRSFVPSRLFIYYNEREIEGTIPSDSGAMLRDGMKTVNQQGVCPEQLWPYDGATGEENEHFAVRPSVGCYTEAERHQVLKYLRLSPVLSQLKGCIAAGYPFVFGFTVFRSFMDARVRQTGEANLPTPDDEIIGGHAVMAVGYDDAAGRFTLRNSWGEGWGDRGYFTFPYEYLVGGLARDLWTVRLVEDDGGRRPASPAATGGDYRA